MASPVPSHLPRGLGVVLFGIVLELSAIAFALIQMAMGASGQLGLPYANVASSLAGLGIAVALAGALLLWVRAW